MTELFGTLFPLNNILSHIKLIPPLGRDFIMQKTLIHCCWVHLAPALMKPPPPPPSPLLLFFFFCGCSGALVRQSTRDRDNKMQLEPQQKEGFIHWSGEKRCCWGKKKKKKTSKEEEKEDKFSEKCQHFFWSRNLSLLTPRVLLWGADGSGGPHWSLVWHFIWGPPLTPRWKAPGWYDERKLWVFF